MRHSLITFTRAVVIGVAISVAGPALACTTSVSDLGAEVYCGKYRGGPKTSFYKTPDGRLGTFFHYDTLADLLDALPSDDEMRQLATWQPAGPPARLAEESQNVEVPAYIVAVKPGEDDHDMHVIISDRPRGARRHFMNVEVSGLPRDHVNEVDFVRVRAEIRAILPEVDTGGSGRYIPINPPARVLVQGSLFFDGDHRAGCGNCPGPSFAKPTTVWEIHPVYSIKEQ
jgi:hypothetical protein